MAVGNEHCTLPKIPNFLHEISYSSNLLVASLSLTLVVSPRFTTFLRERHKAQEDSGNIKLHEITKPTLPWPEINPLVTLGTITTNITVQIQINTVSA